MGGTPTRSIRKPWIIVAGALLAFALVGWGALYVTHRAQVRECERILLDLNTGRKPRAEQRAFFEELKRKDCAKKLGIHPRSSGAWVSERKSGPDSISRIIHSRGSDA